jgi:CBS domain containing-hemolysin-like protein/mannitol/fructose-specific phosphotransferase system IIA component (Ntr-type)
MTAIYLFIAILLLLLNAFFVLAEFAAVKARPTRMEELAAKGDKRAKLVRYIQEHLDQYLSVCQVGITFCSIGLGFVGEPSFARLLQPAFAWAGAASDEAAHTAAFISAYVLVSFLHILIGELVPKSIAIRATEPAALWTARPIRFFHFVFYVPLTILNASSNALLRLTGLRSKASDDHHTEEEIRIILGQSQGSGVLSFRRLLFIENVLDFGGLTVRDAMRMRTQTRTLDARSTRAEQDRTICESRYTRYPLIDGDADRPVGIVNVKDLYFAERQGRPAADLRSVAKAFLETRETTPLESVLADMQRRAQHVAIVSDQHGRWTGLLTMEDAIEEVIGTIEEEYPTEAPTFIGDALQPSHVALDVKGERIDDAVRDAFSRIGDVHLPVPAAALADAVAKREALASTYLGRGIAMPHARVAHLEKPLLFVARLDQPIPTGIDEETIRLLFILITPQGMPRIHQRLQARLAGILESDYVHERLRQAVTPEEVVDAIHTAEQAVLA